MAATGLARKARAFIDARPEVIGLSEVRFWGRWFEIFRESPIQGRYGSFPGGLHIKVRRDDRDHWLEDQFCELLVSNLGLELDVPILPMRLVAAERLGPSLVSPDLDRLRLEGVTVEQVLLDQRANLAAFEEWVMNVDDKPEHVRLIGSQGAPRLIVLDHGHTLHAWKEPLRTIDGIQTHSSVLEPASNFHPYGTLPPPALRDAATVMIERGKLVLDSVVRATCDQYLVAATGSTVVRDSVSEVAKHAELARSILTRRGDHLLAILTKKYDQI